MHSFIVEQLLSLAPGRARVLDFGSGDGALVAALRSAGFDACGADIAEDGMTATAGPHVHAIDSGRLPFADASFDAVCANQVFEHVVDLELALAQVRRVLRPGGVFLNIFPSVGVVREGHCGIALAHWLQRWPSAQRAYLQLGRFLGFGYFVDHRTCTEWAAHMGNYLQHFTVYRPMRSLLREHQRHFAKLERREEQLAVFRLKGIPAKLARSVPPLTRLAVCALGTMVLVARAA